jgi:hypothetical protein
LLPECGFFTAIRVLLEFLDSLTYNDKSTPGTKENYAEWDRNIEVNKK